MFIHFRPRSVLIFTLTALAVVSSASAATYYVSPVGSDGFDGSLETPWASIRHAVGQLEPGDRALVFPGVYRESVVVDRGGTPGSRITIQGLPGAVLESPDPGQSLSAFDLPGTAHVRIEGFELRGGFGETIYLRPGAEDIELVDLDIHGNHNGIWIQGASGVRVQGVTVRENGRAAVRVFGGAGGVSFVDTVSEYNSDGAGCDGDADGFSVEADVSNLRFERVSAIGNSEDGFDIKAPSPTLLQVVSHANGCTGMKLWKGAYVENALVEENRVGITAGGSPDAPVILQSVTVADNATGVRGAGDNYSLILLNSIIAGPGKAISYDSRIALIEDYNILFRPQKGPLIEQLDGPTEHNYTVDDVDSGRWQVESGQGAHTFVHDPEFVGSDDRCPDAASPAVDSGAPAGVPPIDILGVPRPAGGGVDRGAYERPQNSASLSIRTLRMAIRGNSRDRLRLRAWLVPSNGFDPLPNGFSLSLQDSTRELLYIAIPASAVRAHARGVTARVRLPRGRLQLMTHRHRDDTLISLYARGLDLTEIDCAAIECDDLHLVVSAGAARASASVTVEYGADTFTRFQTIATVK